MKIRLVDKTIHKAERAEIVDGRLEIDIVDKTAEESQEAFSTPSNLTIIELLTDEEEVFGVLPDWTVYGGVVLNGERKTVILTKAVNVTEQRITRAESDALAAKTATGEQKEEIDKIKMEIAEGSFGIDKDLFGATVVVSKANAQTLLDEYALQAKALYDTFDELVERKYTADKKGFKFRDGDSLYKTAQDNVTFQEHYRPGKGTESLYTKIDESHKGTLDDPIPYSGNMELENGKHYIQDGIVYLCNRDTEIAVHQALKDLVGIYVATVE